MKRKFPYLLSMLLIYTLTLLTVISTIGCFKRVGVPLENEKLDPETVVYVFLISGEERKVRHPRVENEFLIGFDGNDEVKIPLGEIKKIEAVKPDEKKTLRNAAIVVAAIVVWV
jgi:hypothetical protein